MFEDLISVLSVSDGVSNPVTLRAKMLGLMLGHRFGDLSDAVVNRLKDANEDQLKEWLINAISAPTLDAVFNDDTTH